MLPNAANFEVTALSIATRRAKHHKMDLQTLSLEHLQNRITACQLMEGRVVTSVNLPSLLGCKPEKKPKQSWKSVSGV